MKTPKIYDYSGLTKELAKQHTAKELSEILKIPATTLARYMRKHNIEFLKRKQYDYSKITEEYSKNHTVKEMSNELKIPTDTLIKFLKENNYEYKKENNTYDYSLLTKEYVQQKTISEIVKDTKIPYYAVSRFLKNNNLEYKNTYKQHKVDENYFETIDTPEKAYILGFIMADGCVCKTKPTNTHPSALTINISYIDKCILEFIKKELQCDYDIKEYIPASSYASKKMVVLRICNKKICSDLQKHGIVERKTGKECVPNTIPDKFIRDFIRGFLDGDGSIVSRKDNNISITFTSCENMCIQLKNFLVNKLNLEGKCNISKDNRHENVFNLKIHKKSDTKKIIDFLYNDASFYLERKYNKTR